MSDAHNTHVYTYLYTFNMIKLQHSIPLQ